MDQNNCNFALLRAIIGWMPEATDMDLVRDYADHNADSSFAELVRRHINLVSSKEDRNSWHGQK